MAEGISSGYGISTRKIALAPNAGNPDAELPAVPAEHRRRYEQLRSWFQEAPCRIIYGGSIGLINDVPWIVPVAKSLIDNHQYDFHLLVVGDGGEQARLDNAIDSVPDEIAGRICSVGPVPKPVYLNLLADATFALNLVADVRALDMASPNKVYEAWALGVPVASNQGGWLAEAIASDRSGIALPRDHDFAATLLASVSSDELIELRAGALRASRRSYSWDRVAQTVHSCLLHAVHARRSDGYPRADGF